MITTARRKIARLWADTPIACAAHLAVRRLPPDGCETEILSALSDVEKTLDSHRATYG